MQKREEFSFDTNILFKSTIDRLTLWQKLFKYFKQGNDCGTNISSCDAVLTNDTDIDNFDPSGKILIEACVPLELYRISNEISSVQGKYAGKISNVLTPEVYIALSQPCHRMQSSRALYKYIS